MKQSKWTCNDKTIKKLPPLWRESNILIGKLSLEDEIEHLFALDIEHKEKRVTSR